MRQTSKLHDILFFAGMATLFTHEMDAMLNHEWRVLPLTSWLPDQTGMQVFLFFHIPLFAVLIGLVASSNEIIRYRSRIGISIFLVFHSLLHALFTGRSTYEFASIPSILLIYGGALFGFLHLILELRENRK
jgi:hypothetical protein